MFFSEHFSRQNLLRSLSSLLFLLRWNKNGAKECLKNHIPFDFSDDSTLANQAAGKTIEKPLKELPWNQQNRSQEISLFAPPGDQIVTQFSCNTPFLVNYLKQAQLWFNSKGMHVNLSELVRHDKR